MITSLTRMVFLKYKKDGRIDQFLMTIVGDKEYHDKNIGSLADNSYLTMEKYFSGKIYFHDVAGKFINGWFYEKEKVVGKITPYLGGGLPIELKMATTCLTTTTYTTYVQCTDWYSYCEGYIRYLYTACGSAYVESNSHIECPVYFTGINDYGVSYISDGSTVLPPPPPAPIEKNYEKIMGINSLSITQNNLLETALNKLINEQCLTQTVYNSLVGSGVKINFKMNSGGSLGQYYSDTKTITFKYNSSITAEVLKEELFHAAQDNYYSGGITQYTNTGRVNIEFEAKLYKDIMAIACCGAFQIGTAPEEVKNSYEVWVRTIQDDSSNISDMQYQYWLNLFNQYTPGYSSPLSPNLSSPNALKSLISSCIN